MRRAEIGCLIFDVDGTLYRQAPVRRGMAIRLLANCARNPVEGWRTASFVRHYRRAQESLRKSGERRDQLAVACERAGVAQSWGEKCVERWINEGPLDLVAGAIYPELVTFLEKARERSMKLAVLSDYPAERKLSALGLSAFFSCVVSAVDPRVRRFKPDPSGLLTVMAECGSGTSETIYVGDRPEVDAEAARRAGVQCIIVGQRHGASGIGWEGVPNYKALGGMLGIN